MGSICWCCGKPANPWWTDSAGVRRCDPCHGEQRPPSPEHVGKLSAMDMLPAALLGTTDDAWEFSARTCLHLLKWP